MGSVLHLEYIVEPHRDLWTVRMQGGDRAGTFRSRREALKAAMMDAERVCELGHHVRVFACRADGSLKKIADRPATHRSTH